MRGGAVSSLSHWRTVRALLPWGSGEWHVARSAPTHTHETRTAPLAHVTTARRANTAPEPITPIPPRTSIPLLPLPLRKPDDLNCSHVAPALPRIQLYAAVNAARMPPTCKPHQFAVHSHLNRPNLQREGPLREADLI